MDRATANRLCQAAGVSEVPAGVDPQSWLDDNDVFEIPEDTAGQAEVQQEVFGPRAAQAEVDHERINSLIEKLKADGYVHTTAFGLTLRWEPLASGLWGATSAMPNSLQAGFWTNGPCEKPLAVRHEYGNATAYYVLANLLDSCLEAWWHLTLKTGYRVGDGDPVAGVRWAAKHALEMADKYADCLGGDDATRFIAKVGREKLERLASL